MNRQKILRAIRALLMFIAMVAVASWAADWLRAPALPESALYQAINAQGTSLATLSQQRPVLVYVWGTWCPICKLTSPTVNALATQGVAVQTVALRSGTDTQIRQYQAVHGWHFATLADPDGRHTALWNISVTPTFMVVYHGKVVFSTTGWSSRPGLQLRLWAARFL